MYFLVLNINSFRYKKSSRQYISINNIHSPKILGKYLNQKKNLIRFMVGLFYNNNKFLIQLQIDPVIKCLKNLRPA
jgi:hypothetical protein